MFDAEHVFWDGYARELADLMHLRDWDIRIDRDAQPDDGAGADILVWFGQKRATIRLRLELYRLAGAEDRIDQRRGLIHELLHCHSEELRETVRIRYRDSDAEADRLFCEYHERALENFVDGIATFIADLYPAPAPPEGIAR